jgi:hypothetical protein
MSKRPGKEFQQIIGDFEKWATDLQRQQAQREAGETARRAKLSPQERAAEDEAKDRQRHQAERQALRKKLIDMGDAVLKRETWTIDKFCWLLVAENPDSDDSWGFFSQRSGRVAEDHRQFSTVIESCIGTRLQPVNSQDAPKTHRFAVTSLIETARAKGLGCIDVLAELVEKQSADKPATTTIGGSIPEPRVKTTGWQDTLAALCAEIEQAVKKGELPAFQKHEVPWSPQTLYRVLTLRYDAAGLGKLSVNADTVRKHLNKVHGWKSRAGYQAPHATLQLRKALNL